MNPINIKVLSDEFLVFSLSCGAFDIAALDDYKFDYAVILSPSIAADFYIKVYTKTKDLIKDNYAAAISAAAFLVLERGLPLTEISFETNSGIIDVFYTDLDVFSVSILKCKELCTKTTESLGCEMNYTDVTISGTVRALESKDSESFDLSVLSDFLHAGERFPDAVILTSMRDKKLSVYIYNEYNPAPLTTLHSYAVAAFLQKTAYREKIFFGDNISYFTKEYSTVTVATKPIIME